MPEPSSPEDSPTHFGREALILRSSATVSVTVRAEHHCGTLTASYVIDLWFDCKVDQNACVATCSNFTGLILMGQATKEFRNEAEIKCKMCNTNDHVLILYLTHSMLLHPLVVDVLTSASKWHGLH